MAGRCTRCGAQAPLGASVCYMCGGQVVQSAPSPFEVGVTQPAAPAQLDAARAGSAGQQPQQPQPRQQPMPAQAQAWGQPPAQAQAWGPAPGGWQPPMQPAMGAAPGYGPSYPQGPMAPGPYGPPPPKESNFKLGCGVAGCVGVLLVLLLVAGGLYYMLTQQRDTASETGPSSGRRGAPQSGSLKSIVKEKVGPYHLVGSGEQVSEDRLRAGSVDSMALKYRSDGGVDVKHFLVAYQSESEARDMPQVVIEIIREHVPAGQTFKVTSGPYSNRDGETIGTKYHVELDPEVVIWTNGKLLAVVEASPPHASKFFEAVPY